MAPQAPLDRFLEPLHIDVDKAHVLSGLFLRDCARLCAESQDQFLPTPISDSILRPVSGRGQGRYLAIDIGGTNLRVGFVELLSRDAAASLDGASQNGQHGDFTRPSDAAPDRIRRQLEHSWPIDDHLKNDNADRLFSWIGSCIADVVREGCAAFRLAADEPLPLGVTFSFPMDQRSLSEATLMSMGKGFAVSSRLDLGSRLLDGYTRAAAACGSALPPIHIAAIANDAVSTLVSFIFRYDENAQRRAAMGLILGTGCNATVPLPLSLLHPSKRPDNVSLLPGEGVRDDVRITVNTELSINGTAPPMREVGLITRWDEVLDAQTEAPGFQPLEYMTAGRYLGELGRIMMVDYLTSVMGLPAETLPRRLRQRHGLTTTFLSHFKPLRPAKLLLILQREFPESSGAPPFVWTEALAEALYRIAKAIEVRAAGIIAAAVLALLTLAKDLPEDPPAAAPEAREIGVGYTGGCIVHFQDYSTDCQDFIDQLMARRFGAGSPLRVGLCPCHDGGITGAGILAAAALSSKRTTMP